MNVGKWKNGSCFTYGLYKNKIMAHSKVLFTLITYFTHSVSVLSHADNFGYICPWFEILISTIFAATSPHGEFNFNCCVHSNEI